MSKKNKLIIFFLSFISLILFFNFVGAQDFGMDVVDNNLGGILGQSGSDPRVLIVRIIQIALSFLGLIALLLILYAGFLWMTSSGAEEKIDQAKKILKNALIGLVIILSSWAIVTFIISRFTGSLGSAVNPSFNFNQNVPQVNVLGALGACTIENVYPENGQKDVPRNTAITVNFKEPLAPDSVCITKNGSACICGEVLTEGVCSLINPQAVRIFKTELEDACVSGSCPDANANLTNVTVSLSEDRLTLILFPQEYLGNPGEKTNYSVKLSSDLKKDNGKAMLEDCRLNYFVWSFEVSTILDLTPPQIVRDSLYPRPDNEKDYVNLLSEARAAEALITVLACPNVYKSSTIKKVIPSEGSPEISVTPLNYQGDLTNFLVVIPAESKDKVQLFNGENPSYSLGIAGFDSQGNARFGDFFLLKAPDRDFGNSWEIELVPEVKADTLTIGDYTYIFSNISGANNIALPLNCQTKEAAAEAIFVGLSGDSLVNVSQKNNDEIILTSKIAGPGGNEIKLKTSSGFLRTSSFIGGEEKKLIVNDGGRKDVPMNTVIQLNFNEPVNPLQVAGLASEVANYIKVLNYDEDAREDGAICSQDSDCKSYNCREANELKTCFGSYLSGKFLVSNNYRTLEFVSDKECGVNGCGEKVYCLPPNSHLAVEIRSADLKICNTDEDCSSFSPYTKCLYNPELKQSTCQNPDFKNYPTARIEEGRVTGVVDLSFNSFDGNRNKYSDGPITHYDDNFISGDESNNNRRDNYRFSFYVNDEINLTPPKIEMISPSANANDVGLAENIKITWNTLMMNSTLRTGQSVVDTGQKKITHKLINLSSFGSSGLGYWVNNENNDTDFDGEPDQTISWVKHSGLAEGMTYRVQVGSGVKDIFQNCFKPSDGEGCIGVSDINPSCCFGKATDILSQTGNCQ